MCSYLKIITTISLVKSITTHSNNIFSWALVRSTFLDTFKYTAHIINYSLQAVYYIPMYFTYNWNFVFWPPSAHISWHQWYIHCYIYMLVSLCSSVNSSKAKTAGLPHSTVAGTKQFLNTWSEWKKDFWSQLFLASLLIHQNVANCRGNKNKPNIYRTLPFAYSKKPITYLSGWVVTSRPINCTLYSLRSSSLLPT